MDREKKARLFHGLKDIENGGKEVKDWLADKYHTVKGGIDYASDKVNPYLVLALAELGSYTIAKEVVPQSAAETAKFFEWASSAIPNYPTELGFLQNDSFISTAYTAALLTVPLYLIAEERGLIKKARNKLAQLIPARPRKKESSNESKE